VGLKKAGLIVVLMLVLVGFIFTGVFPETATAEPEPEFDGYIVKLRESGARLFSADTSGLDALCPEENLFRADELSDIEELQIHGLVEYAEPNYRVQLFADVNDPYYSRQWNVTEIGAPAGWDSGLSGAGVRIGLIDSGLNIRHEELSGANFSEGENLVDGTSDVTDSMGHGTFIGGVIAAATNNGKGIAGIADRATLVPLKCFSASSDTSVAHVIKAIYRAIDVYDVDVINLSLGLAENLQAFKDAIEYAEKCGVIVVSAVGNNYDTRIFYPAAYNSVIGVGSVDRLGNHSSFSQVNSSVFIAAPGEDLLSLGHDSENSYAQGKGTSHAASHVTALAALALEYNPKLTPAEFRDILAASADDLGTRGYDQYYGHGRINIKRALEELTKYGTGNTPPAAVGQAHSAQASYIAPMVVDMNGWFMDEEGNALTYVVYSSTASGAISINGSELTYRPSAKDADKTIRVVIEARDRESKSELNAILNISVYSDIVPPGGGFDAFGDLKGHWAYGHIAFIVERGLMSGVDSERFAPDINVSRAMFVTILSRLSGESLTGYGHSFSDVPAGWYSDSVAWASSRGIVNGISAASFGPDMDVSRQQIAVFLYRYATLYGLTDGRVRSGVYYGYEDAGNIADWASDAMLWAVSNGIISGTTDSTLNPAGNATRAQAATMLLRFINTFVK